MNALAFIISYISKQKYRKDLKIWIEMVNEYAVIDIKYRAVQRTAELLVYLSSDAKAKEQMKQKINS